MFDSAKCCTRWMVNKGDANMTDTQPVHSTELSRRTVLLQGAVCAAGAVGLIGATTQAKAAKVSQKAVSYQDSPKGSQQCSNCNLFQAPNLCKSVDGTVSPSGWCRIWVKKG